MKRVSKPQKLIQLGEALVKENHVRRIVRFCQLSYSKVPFIPKPLVISGELSPEIADDVISCVNEHLDTILWEYEGQYLYERALRLVAIRPRSEKEFYDFFKKNSDNDKSVVLCMERMTPFINDEEFSEYFVAKERSHNPKGDLVIKQKLKLKGIDERIIEKSLSINEEEKFALIGRQYEKNKARIMRKAIKKGIATKILFEQYMKQYLFSKGFSSEEINNFLKENNEMGI